MKTSRKSFGSVWKSILAKTAMAGSIGLAFANVALAQQGGSPWENAVNVLQQAFTGTIAKGLALVAIVVGGLTFAFGEGGGKRTFAGLIFGLGMAVLAVNFLTWLFGV
jgi:type IV secretory pathway VirB2 component (pilin)